jgi:hypothetical protein
MPRTSRRPTHAGSWYELERKCLGRWHPLSWSLPLLLQQPAPVEPSPIKCTRFDDATGAKLDRQIADWLAAAPPHGPGAPAPRAIIGPHAGHRYCGHVMAHAYAPIDPFSVCVRQAWRADGRQSICNGHACRPCRAHNLHRPGNSQCTHAGVALAVARTCGGDPLQVCSQLRPSGSASLVPGLLPFFHLVPCPPVCHQLHHSSAPAASACSCWGHRTTCTAGAAGCRPHSSTRPPWVGGAAELAAGRLANSHSRTKSICRAETSSRA